MKFFRHLILQKSWVGTADVFSRMVDLSSPKLSSNGSSWNSFLMPNKFDPVGLLMSPQAKLTTSLTSMLSLTLAQNLQNLDSILSLRLGIPAERRLSTR